MQIVRSDSGKDTLASKTSELKNKLTIIIGAGASVPMGIPTMKGFTKEFERHCNEILSEVDAKWFIKYDLRYLKKKTERGF